MYQRRSLLILPKGRWPRNIESDAFDPLFILESIDAGPVQEDHRILVYTGSGEQEKIVLGISAVVDPRLEIIPRAISFGRVRNGQEANPREVSIVSRFREPAQIISVSSSQPYIKATLLPRKAAPKREVGRIRIELCADAPCCKLDGNIVVTTGAENRMVNSSIKVVAEILGPVETISY